ncbi:head-tail connector protein [Sphingomonas montana]|uniref:head-tail connector protein n=1 Tax=Sphingomonas montana TaxID=1843236 RepID=UPI00096E5960|nr:phage head-tail connector protein [Sphingomonas montana]
MAEPVSMELARAQLRVDPDAAQDLLIEQAIVAAREWVERYTGHLLVRREVAEVFGSLSGTVDLHAWPNVEVTRVDYLAADGNVTLDKSNYVVSPMQRPAQLGLVAPSGWGQFGRAAAGAATSSIVTVTMQAGYAEDEVPGRLIRAMRLLITDDFENRGDGDYSAKVIAAAESICRSDRRVVV